MNKLLKDTISFCLICVAIDFAVAALLKKARPIDYGAFVESRELFFKSKNNYDVLFMGDSHIADAVNVKIFENACSVTAYNLGIYHATPFDNYFVLRKIIDLGKIPKYIVLGTNPDMFYKKAEPSKYIYSILDDRKLNVQMNLNSEEKFEGLSLIKFANEKYLLPIVFNKIANEKYKPTREVKSVYNGFLEFHNQMSNLDWMNFKIERGNANRIQVEYFLKCIELAKENNIEIIIFNPPIWKDKLNAFEGEAKYFKNFNNTVNEIKAKHHLKIYNENHKKLVDNLVQRDFLNPDHLNCFGANKITHDFAEWFNQNRNVIR